MDEEPDAEKFDQNLFDVRKLYKRPEEDRLRQTEINRIKDAIDRCLISYRAIKEEEYEKEQREEEMRRRQEDLDRRAAALREQRAREASLFGMPSLRDKFQQQQAANALFGSGTFAQNHPELFYKKNERLDLEDPDLDNIRREIDEMEKAKRLILLGRLNMTTGEVEGVNEYELPEPEEILQEQPVNVIADKEPEPVQEPQEKTEEEIAIEKAKKAAQEIEKPTSKPVRAMRNFKPVDESKIKLGKDPVGYQLRDDITGSAFGFAMTGFKRVNVPVVEEKEEKPVSQILTPSPEDFNPWAERPGNEEVKVHKVPSVKTFKPVDINKSRVGDAPVKYDREFGLENTGFAFTMHTPYVPKTQEMAFIEQPDEEEPVQEKPVQKAPSNPWAITTIRGRKAQQASLIAKQTHHYKPVDESKVEVGNSPVDRYSTRDILGNTFGMQRANLGKLNTPHDEEIIVDNKPKKEKKKVEKKAEKPVQPAVVSVEVHREEKPKIDKDPWGLSPTTINQKYSKKSGKQKVFKPIDENKVSVGDLPVGMGSIQDIVAQFGTNNPPKKDENPEDEDK